MGYRGLQGGELAFYLYLQEGSYCIRVFQIILADTVSVCILYVYMIQCIAQEGLQCFPDLGHVYTRLY